MPTKKSRSKSQRASPTKAEAKLVRENKELRRERDESLEREAATSDILRVIASSPTNLQPVLDAVASSVTRLCDASDAVIVQLDGPRFFLAAHSGPHEAVPVGSPVPLGRGFPGGRAVLDGTTVVVADLAEAVESEFPETKAIQQRYGYRSMVATPLLREGSAIGALAVLRTEVRPFTEKQIALLKTFADQAVIAIENARLIHEQQARNRDLTEALEQQTATSEILRVIASSPTDIQPVLDVVAQNAARLCDAVDAQIMRVDGNMFRLVASHGSIPVPRRDEARSIIRGLVAGRAILDREAVHVHDVSTPQAQAEFPETWAFSEPVGIRTGLATPLLREGIAIGAILIRRVEVRPFTDRQIALLKTFADQAVIAIENVRLFQEVEERNAELREALEHQTATAEVLGIISRSPTDVQPVLDAIVESAARVCGIDDVLLRLREDNAMVLRAHFGRMVVSRPEIGLDAPEYGWMEEHGVLHIPDVRAQKDFPLLGRFDNFRTFLAAPLRKKGNFIGMLTARRMEIRPFTPAQIKLLETFADQAVIAIENVRLFQELKESLEQQTATSEILGVIASSPTDIQPVLETVAKNAAGVCGATDATITMQIEGGPLRKVAEYGAVQGSPIGTDFAMDRNNVIGRAFVDRETIHVHDFLAVAADFAGSRAPQHGYRTMLGTPLLREGCLSV
jgi:GAF domain-containing protein